jgi:hypothetical protein
MTEVEDHAYVSLMNLSLTKNDLNLDDLDVTLYLEWLLSKNPATYTIGRNIE